MLHKLRVLISSAFIPLHGGNLVKDISINRSVRVLDEDSPNLPIFSQNSESTLTTDQILPVDGTNVLKVPFGVRAPRRKKPQSPKRMATLVLTFNTIGSPTPPHAA